MRKLTALLRSRKGLTLAEMIAAMALLSMAIAMIAMLLPPVTRMVRQLEDLNNAQMIANTVLENVRSQVELARGYIKCYDTETPLGQNGLSEGTSIEFRTATNHVILISAEGCGATLMQRPKDVTMGTSLGTSEALEKGRLSFRYYTMESNGSYLFQNAEGTLVARAVDSVLGAGFYDGYQLSLYFAIGEGSRTVNITATISRSDGRPVYEETQVVDLRYAPPLDLSVTAVAGS